MTTPDPQPITMQQINEMLSKEYQVYRERVAKQAIENPTLQGMKTFKYTEFLEYLVFTLRQALAVKERADQKRVPYKSPTGRKSRENP